MSKNNVNNKYSTTMKDKIKKILQDYMLTDLTLNDATQQVLYLFSVSGSAVCPYCNGDGWTAEHESHPHPDGDCMGMCPIQVQCPHCEATGKVTQEVLDNYNENVKVSDDSELPF